jgi:hypothetical protein
VAVIGAALTALAATLPSLFIPAGHSPGGAFEQPPIALLAVFGLTVLAGIGLILFVATRLGLELSKSVTIGVFAFNAAIILVKFVLSPLGLYISNSSQPFIDGSDGGFFNAYMINNDQSGFVYAAIGAAVAYLLALFIIYRVTKPKVPKEPAAARHMRRKLIIFAAIALAIAVGWQFALALGFILVSPLSDYLSKLGPMVSIVFVVLAIGVILAVLAFKTAANEVNLLRRPLLFAALFWLCLALILMYHVLWVVFMTALVAIWPFQTVVPVGGK